MRSLILGQSTSILQDDSGMPFRFLRPPDWRVTLYGHYEKPVKDFNYGYQPDLARAYASGQPKPLPFSYGYHWKDGFSSVMFAVRSAPVKAAPSS